MKETRMDGQITFGSHTNTVKNGERFDGTIGVIAGIELARVLKENHLTLELATLSHTDPVCVDPSIVNLIKKACARATDHCQEIDKRTSVSDAVK